MTALLIGNSAYPECDELKNPTNDATDLAEKLKGYGFEVLSGLNCTAKEMDIKLQNFAKSLEKCEVGLFFFAGHGMQIDGSNYLLATDTNMDSEMDAKFSSMNLDKVMEIMDKSTASTKIVMLDACRNDPWQRSWHRGRFTRGLASVYAPKGTIIGFATSPGQYAYDGDGRNGTYTSALLQHINTLDCTIEIMFKRVRNTVAAATKGAQISWEHTSLSEEFHFNRSLGNLVNEYYGIALKDRLFTLDESLKSHRIILGLKTYTWHKQNDALDQLNHESADEMSKNDLFVIGRNIYQAACGSSNSAVSFIEHFERLTQRYSVEKRKALLDGMLIEIFFNSDGEIRKDMKFAYFNDVFALQRNLKFKPSFDFVAQALVSTGVEFYVIPGKEQELSVTITIKADGDVTEISGVYIDGNDVLELEEGFRGIGSNKEHLYRMTLDQFENEILKKLIVSKDKLKLTFTPDLQSDVSWLSIQRGWAIKKR